MYYKDDIFSIIIYFFYQDHPFKSASHHIHAFWHHIRKYISSQTMSIYLNSSVSAVSFHKKARSLTDRLPAAKWTARGLCTKNLLTEPIFQDIPAKNRRFACQKYLYGKIVSSDPGNLKKRGLRIWFFRIEKIWHEKLWFPPHFCGKWGLTAQKSRIDPTMIF